MTTKRWNMLILVSMMMGLLWIYISRVPANASVISLSSPQTGFAAPNFQLETLEGQTVSLSDFNGKVVLINVWASWCPPCRAEMPTIDKVYRQYHDSGFVVLGLNATSQDSESEVRLFAQTFGLSFPIVLDRDGSVIRRYQVQAFPTSFFVGRDGTVREVVFGNAMNETFIATKIQGLLAETKP